MKSPDVDQRLQTVLPTLLSRLKGIEIGDTEFEEVFPRGFVVDFVLQVKVGGEAHFLAVDTKRSGELRTVRSSIERFKDLLSGLDRDGTFTPVIVAPYLSPAARQVCKDADVAYADLEGNAWISFRSVLIDREVESVPRAERQELRSLFSPRSARVLRVLLSDVHRGWKVADLAGSADVSVGLVSKIRHELASREWGSIGDDGFRILHPDALLDAWREAYEAPGERHGFYTTLHGARLDQAIRSTFADDSENEGLLLASLSAAAYLAPFARSGSTYFYANEAGLRSLEGRLELSSSSKGENVVVNLLSDEIVEYRKRRIRRRSRNAILGDRLEPAPGIFTTGSVQTYLDLWTSGERGQEAAEHLRAILLAWRTK